ncbi:MAG: multiheme c-type cytochrome [Wenzhouxiangellaceae bacterium]|nr:multiheme c-type cytochrome [Wenzhouxiangellaceae bacterium]
MTNHRTIPACASALLVMLLAGPVASQDYTKEQERCIDCHERNQPAMVADWRSSRHAAEGVSCWDCHVVEADSPMGVEHRGHPVSLLVPPTVCAECHEEQVEQFNASGHFRAYRQQIPKGSLHALTAIHEGREHPEFGAAPNETGCMQCHGTEIKLGDNGVPTPETWPNSGIGNVYPDGSTGSCGVCHTRHAFANSEARKPYACASCHLGPDHPNIEIYENSKHGHIYRTEGHTWNFDGATGEWQPGEDYRAPTCATCHMSQIGDVEATHNVTERLHWVQWAPKSSVRDSDDVLSPIHGDGEKGRLKMTLVCEACHSVTHTDGFFAQADKAVKLYNTAYYEPATKMLDDLREKGLLKENAWTDEFQVKYYFLWHHEGRRARMGATHGAPDYAHWHGFFELMLDLYELEQMYEKRIETGSIVE